MGNRVFQQHVFGIPMGVDCAPLLAIIYTYFTMSIFNEELNEIGLYSKAIMFNFTVRNIDDLLTLNNAVFVKEITKSTFVD